jgi:hypothetical protein
MSKHYDEVRDLRSLKEMGMLAKPSEEVFTREPLFEPLGLDAGRCANFSCGSCLSNFRAESR